VIPLYGFMLFTKICLSRVLVKSEWGTLLLIPLYGYMLLTKTFPHSQIYVVGLVVVFIVIDIRLSSLFYWYFMDVSLDI